MSARPARRTSSLLARVAIAALAGGAFPSQAAVLYKSIGPNGVIQFSDTPPEDGVVVEERRIAEAPSDGQPLAGAPGGSPSLAFQNPLEAATDNGLDPDDALARANQQVDLAEHALALARASTWARREGLHLRTPQRAATDDARIAFYERNLRAARANLLALMNRGEPPFPLQTADAPQSPLRDTSGVRVANR